MAAHVAVHVAVHVEVSVAVHVEVHVAVRVAVYVTIYVTALVSCQCETCSCSTDKKNTLNSVIFQAKLHEQPHLCAAFAKINTISNLSNAFESSGHCQTSNLLRIFTSDEITHL